MWSSATTSSARAKTPGRAGKTYKIIREYIEKNECKCVLLSATPYNKTYLDLSNQLRLFIPDAKPLSIRPERLLAEMGDTEFVFINVSSPSEEAVDAVVYFRSGAASFPWAAPNPVACHRDTAGPMQNPFG